MKQIDEITLPEMYQEVLRETSMRQKVYSKHVDEGRMNPNLAEFRINVMQAVLKLIENQQRLEVLPLFQSISNETEKIR